LARPCWRVAADSIDNRGWRLSELQFDAMLDQLREILGMRPPLAGLEEILGQVADRKLPIDEAARQIRESASRSHTRFQPAILRIFAFTGACFALVGIGIGLYNASYSFGTEKTQATVIRIESGSPVVEYDVKGNHFSLRSPISATSPSYTIGEKVNVLYRPRDPSAAQIDTFTDRWLFPSMFTGIGLISMLIGIFGPRFLNNLTGTIEGQFSTGAGSLSTEPKS